MSQKKLPCLNSSQKTTSVSFFAVAAPRGGGLDWEGLVPPDPKSQQKLSKENHGINLVGYTSRLKIMSKSPPPPQLLLDFSELVPPLILRAFNGILLIKGQLKVVR